MDRSRYSLLLIILLLVSGCRSADDKAQQTPTPFTSIGVVDRAPVGEPIPISLTNLSANPELFEGTTLQLRGQYQPLPTLICQRDPFPSPATWGLVADGLQANATGLDQQLRQLIATGQEITVEGRWLRYSGPIGCGKTAPMRELWYLSVSRIVEPHPLARATSVIAIGPAEPDVLPVESPPTQTVVSTAAPAEPLETETVEATAVPASATYVPSPQATAGPATAQPGATATLIPTPITATPAVTGTAVAGTATSTSTPGGSTATADPSTATPGGETATATATVAPSDGSTNPKGEIDFEDLIMGSLTSGAVDDWTFNLDQADTITITVAPSSSANMIFSVLDPNGQLVLDSQNQSPAGEVETVEDLSLTEPGTYHVQIAAAPAAGTDYALMVMDSSSYAFTFRGTLEPGVQRSDSLVADNDHFWFFPASDGDNIDLRVMTSGEADAYVELYGPDGSRLLTLDDTGTGETESLENHSILASGLYAVRVGEFDFGAMTYQIVFDIP